MKMVRNWVKFILIDILVVIIDFVVIYDESAWPYINILAIVLKKTGPMGKQDIAR